VEPAAPALALHGASREEADAFLKKQGSLIDIQKHHVTYAAEQRRWQTAPETISHAGQ
jgi:RNA:NAD 2'-phosphotransferase (TPT1/KptA family)